MNYFYIDQETLAAYADAYAYYSSQPRDVFEQNLITTLDTTNDTFNEQPSNISYDNDSSSSDSDDTRHKKIKRGKQKEIEKKKRLQPKPKKRKRNNDDEEESDYEFFTSRKKRMGEGSGVSFKELNESLHEMFGYTETLREGITLKDVRLVKKDMYRYWKDSIYDRDLLGPWIYKLEIWEKELNK